MRSTKIAAKKRYVIEDSALERFLDVIEYFRNQPGFANARTVRNIIDQVLLNQNLRTEDVEGDNTIIADDVDDYLADEGIDLKKSQQGANWICVKGVLWKKRQSSEHSAC